MPTYEYLCQTCSHRFETWQKMTDEPLTTCPECGNSIRRVLFPAGIVFKGSGFYITDHHNGKNSHSSTSETKPSSEANKTTASEGNSSEKANSSSSTTTTAAATTPQTT